MIEMLENLAKELADNGKRLELTSGSLLKLAGNVDVYNLNNIKINSGIVKKISSIVGNEVQLTRNVILPMIKDYKEIVNNYMGSKSTFNPIDDINIDYVEIDELLNNMVDKGIVSDMPVKNLSGDTFLFNRPDDVRPYLTSNVASIDLLLKPFISKVGLDFINETWDNFITHMHNSNPNWDTLTAISSKNINRLIILNIVLQRLITEIPDGLNVNSDKYLTVISTAKDYVSVKLFTMIRRLRDMEKTQKLVISLDTDKKEIIVHNNVLNTYLTNGGVIETILGQYVTGDRSTRSGFMQYHIDNKDILVKKWDSKVNVDTVKHKLNMSSNYKTSYTLGLQQLIKELPDSTKAYLPEYKLTSINNDVIEYVENLDKSILSDIDKVCYDIIVNLLFNFSNASSYLDNMKKYSKLHSNLGPKEVATLAIVDLVIDYLLTQTEVVS